MQWTCAIKMYMYIVHVRFAVYMYVCAQGIINDEKLLNLVGVVKAKTMFRLQGMI